MRDVTEKVLRQDINTRKSPSLDITRFNIYESKLKRVFSVFPGEEVLVKIHDADGKVVEQGRMTEKQAARRVSEFYGRRYFLGFYHSTDHVKIMIIGDLPEEVIRKYEKEENN